MARARGCDCVGSDLGVSGPTSPVCDPPRAPPSPSPRDPETGEWTEPGHPGHCPAASCEPDKLTVSLAAESPGLCNGGTRAVPTEVMEHKMLSMRYPSRAS